MDTIAAVATQIGNSGISVIRISGEGSTGIIKKIFKTNSGLKSHTISYGHIYDGPNLIDEVMVSLMLAPKSYTKEDVAEINCHGGALTTKRIMGLVLQNGARLAEPGEFTKRAFLNGRIDLSQAEAVIDIINAKTELSQNAALSQLGGKLSEKVNLIRGKLLSMIANIEASIDYPEHDMELINIAEVKAGVLGILEDVDNLIKTAEHGKIVSEGIKTVIIGRPNVGKSTLLNKLLGEDRAIVTDIPGTTRDTIEEYINIRGILIKIIDTAGIRHTEDKVEKIGIEKSKGSAQNADLVLFIIDSSDKITDLDIEILEGLKGKKVILVINKIDLPNNADLDRLKNYVPNDNIVQVSLINGQGLEGLYDKVEFLFFNNEIDLSPDILITNIRHKNLLISSAKSLKNVLMSIEGGFSEDFLSIDLVDAYSYLGGIIGESLDEDIIDKIFSEFCLGK
ncbi:MAG: tRNA uridine-5-carboxymethylaminomethyl(34) synthesis GTPase MnmE [Clostridiales bacterium]|nr:tRNA uridine-5-carboxymethylaminomethyl(34) synthesis GTPase MnmE [Clostridiales bacterium]